MKKIIMSFALILAFSAVAQAQETYELRTFMQVYICPEGTLADECEAAEGSRVPIDFSLTLVDQGTKDPMTFLDTKNSNVVRDGISYALEVSIAKYMYSTNASDIFYEVRASLTPEGETKKKVVLNYHNMGEFNTRIDLFGDLYKRGTTKYTPVMMTMPKGLSRKNQLRMPILAEIMASE